MWSRSVTRILCGEGANGAKVDQTTEMYFLNSLIRLFRNVAIHEKL